MNGNDDAGDKPDLESNEPDPKRARIDPLQKVIEETQAETQAETQEKEIRMENTENSNDELGKFNNYLKR